MACLTRTTTMQDLPLWEKVKGKRLPLSFTLEITARCNNNCRHCYINLPAGDKAAKAEELSLEQIERLADEAVSLGSFWCLLTGGEPLLREDFTDIYLNVRKKGLLVSVFTNAVLPTDEHIELFRKYPPRDIEVSVYGVTRETYEQVTRRPGSFKAFMKGLNLLLDNGLKVRFKAMALRSNFHEMQEISQFCRERTKDYFRFDPMLQLRSDGNLARNEEILSERLSPEQVVALEQADPERSKAMKEGCDKFIFPESPHSTCNHLFHCGAGNSSFAVSYNGIFRLCTSLWHPDCIYDLRTGSLTDAWYNFVPKVRDMRSNREEFLGRCRACRIVNLCMQCPAHAHLETGYMDLPVDYFCELAHARAAALTEVS